MSHLLQMGQCEASSDILEVFCLFFLICWHGRIWRLDNAVSCKRRNDVMADEEIFLHKLELIREFISKYFMTQRRRFWISKISTIVLLLEFCIWYLFVSIWVLDYQNRWKILINYKNVVNFQSPRKKKFFRYYLSSAGFLYLFMYVCMLVRL